MFEIAAIVAPVFLVVMIGFGGAKVRLIDDAQVDALLHYLTHFAVPALLFNSVAQLDLGEKLDPMLLAAFYLPCVIVFGIGIMSGQRLFGQRPGESVSSAFTAIFANSVFLGLPIAERAYGAEGLSFALAIVSVHAPILYFLGVVAMETAARDGAGFAAGVAKVVRTLTHNPLLMSVAAGIAFNLSGLTLPDPVSEGLTILGKAALPVGMFAIGATLARYSLGGEMRMTGYYVALGVLLRPALTALCAFVIFPLDPLPAKIAVLVAAMPGGVNIYLFAALYQRSMMLAANVLLVGTAVGIVTVSAWLAWLG